MHKTSPSSPALLQRFAGFLTWTLIFTIAYAQSPLYTSNQNQYFLHGLARAGFGFLDHDWLANTLDPAPVFSLLVNLTYRYLQVEALFYLYYAVLMGVYLFSLIGIASNLYGFSGSKPKTLTLIALIILVHSAGLRFAFSRTLGVNWTYVLEDGLADQRMLGPVFQPSAFGVLLILSVYLFFVRKPFLAVFAAVAAATVHPTYLLSAAALTIAYLVITFLEDRHARKPLILGLVALAAVLPILLYVYHSFNGTSPEATARAQEILVNFRIPHHARISQWLDATALVKIGLVLTATYLARHSRLFLVIGIPFLISAVLTLAQVFLNSDRLALIFPWRLSVFLVPLSLAVILGFLVVRLFELSWTARHLRTLVVLSASAIFLASLVGGIRFALDLQRKASIPERAMLSYVSAHKTSLDLYLTPVKMQDFRLVAGAPVFVEFKSIPYRDTDVLEWYRRIQIADRFYKSPDCGAVKTLADLEGITHYVLEAQENRLSCSGLHVIFQDDYYRVYRLGAP